MHLLKLCPLFIYCSMGLSVPRVSSINHQCKREQPLLSSCQEWQAVAIHFPMSLHPSWRRRRVRTEMLRREGGRSDGAREEAQRGERLALSGFQTFFATADRGH